MSKCACGCGKDVVKRANNQKYATHGCYIKMKLKVKKTKNVRCSVCGKRITKKGRYRYCTKRCADYARKLKIKEHQIQNGVIKGNKRLNAEIQRVFYEEV